MSPSPCTVCGKVRGFGGRQCHGHDVPAPTREEAALAEVTRLRAALQAIAERQPTQHVGDAHRGTMHDDRKSAYYCGVFDGRKDGLFEAAEMARAALVTT